MSERTVKITTAGRTGALTRVEIDGEEQRDFHGVGVNIWAGGIPSVWMEMWPGGVTFEGRAAIEWRKAPLRDRIRVAWAVLRGNR